jgi:hypothetical protein
MRGGYRRAEALKGNAALQLTICKVSPVTVMAYPRYQMLLTRLSNRVARAGMQAANMVNKENMMPMAAAAYESAQGATDRKG